MEYKYSDITEKIIKACMTVHSILGNGFQEVIYQRALAWQLSRAGLCKSAWCKETRRRENLTEPHLMSVTSKYLVIFVHF